MCIRDSPVSVQNGEIEVSGAIGSVHKVEISLEGKSAKADIVLSESGAVPARVELAMPVATSGPTTAPAWSMAR